MCIRDRRVFDNIALKYEYGVASALDVTNSGTTLIVAQNGYVPVSYTHLDVYKRQVQDSCLHRS